MGDDEKVSLPRPVEDRDVQDGEGRTGDDEKVEVKPGIFNTRTKKFTLFCLSLYWFIICCAYSMIAPFFPGEVSI